MDTKTCARCKESKPLSGFFRKGDGYRSPCKECNKKDRQTQESRAAACIRSKAWRKNNPESRRLTRKKSALKSAYGMTHDDLTRMVKFQRNTCMICGSHAEETPKKTLCVDHDHKTGLVRGLLCNHCNHGIGHFFEDIDRMKAAIDYLVDHRV